MGFTGFYWVLPGFIGYYRVLLGFTGFRWVLFSFIGFHWVLLRFTGFYRVLSGFAGFHWVSLGFIRLYRVSLGFTWIYWVLSGFTWIYWVLPGETGNGAIAKHENRTKNSIGPFTFSRRVSWSILIRFRWQSTLFWAFLSVCIQTKAPLRFDVADSELGRPTSSSSRPTPLRLHDGRQSWKLDDTITKEKRSQSLVSVSRLF